MGLRLGRPGTAGSGSRDGPPSLNPASPAQRQAGRLTNAWQAVPYLLSSASSLPGPAPTLLLAQVTSPEASGGKREQ